MSNAGISPKMSRKQAMLLWNQMSPEQKTQFNKMYADFLEGKLLLKEVNVDDNEQIQNIVLEPKDKASQPHAPFAKHFNHCVMDD